MLVCNYCGRNLKNDYDTCPGCGSNSFKKISMTDQYAINTPPKDGYHIKVDSYEKSVKMAKVVKWSGFGLILFMILFDIPFIFGGIMSMDTDASFGASFLIMSLGISSIFYFIAIGMIVFSVKMKKKALNNIERVKQLARTGVLIKNMEYKLQPTGTIINGVPIQCIEVQYESKSGAKIPLRSEPKYSGILGSEDGTADLLIDPKDFSNYYIDFEIY